MYKGDVNPSETYRRIQDDARAVLIDVRTRAEWAFVGVPALDGLLCIEWQDYPSMTQNPNFLAEVEAAGVARDQPVYLICRSGQRSASAASALSAAGYTECYNVAEGFEGDKNDDSHRGATGGWKHAGLPWVQA